MFVLLFLCSVDFHVAGLRQFGPLYFWFYAAVVRSFRTFCTVGFRTPVMEAVL